MDSESLNEDGTYSTISAIDSLGIAEGKGTFGSKGMYYTCARSQNIMKTPDCCVVSDPYIVSNLLGVWA